MYSINGIGTTLYGKRDVDLRDGSYIATKWFIIFLLPVFPLGSFRVIRGATGASVFPSGSKTDYQLSPVKLNVAQVINTYLVIWGIAIPCFIFLFHIAK
jgi:hypothetical protein